MLKKIAMVLATLIISGFSQDAKPARHGALVPEHPHVPEAQHDPNTLGRRVLLPVSGTLSASGGLHDGRIPGLDYEGSAKKYPNPRSTHL
jgi:hypothetical protein